MQCFCHAVTPSFSMMWHSGLGLCVDSSLAHSRADGADVGTLPVISEWLGRHAVVCAGKQRLDDICAAESSRQKERRPGWRCCTNPCQRLLGSRLLLHLSTAVRALRYRRWRLLHAPHAGGARPHGIAAGRHCVGVAWGSWVLRGHCRRGP